jgi:hypothetical protein
MKDIWDIMEASFLILEGVFSLIQHDFPILKELKTRNFDLALMDYTEAETISATYLDIPIMSQAFYLPNQLLWYQYGLPSVLNTQYQLSATVKLIDGDGPLSQIQMKLEESLPLMIGSPYIWFQIATYDKLHEELKSTWNELTLTCKGYVFGLGTEGFRDRV